MKDRDLIDALGARAIAAALGARLSTVRVWRSRARIPARYWIACRELAERAGLEWRPAAPAETGAEAEEAT